MNTGTLIVLIVVILILALWFFLGTKTGKRTRIRASGTADEILTKDASTPEGAKAYYNVAIEKKQDDLVKANTIYSQMLGKLNYFEEQLITLKKDSMKVDLDINTCIEKGDDEAAKIYLKKRNDIKEKIETIKSAIKDLKNNVALQKETVDGLTEALNDLKAEKDNAVFTLETAQVTKSLQATPGVSSQEEDKMLEKVRDGIKKQKEEADGNRIAYENSSTVQQQRVDQKMKDDEIERQLQELKAKRGM